MAGATAGGRAGTAAAIKRRKKKEALKQVCVDTTGSARTGYV